jgi:hypothetical protein
MIFNPAEFIKNLKYMGVGMLGVFIIVFIIMSATYLIGSISSSKKSEKED